MWARYVYIFELHERDFYVLPFENHLIRQFTSRKTLKQLFTCKRFGFNFHSMLERLDYMSIRYVRKLYFIFKQSKIAPLCMSIETVEMAFFWSGLETLQILGAEMSQEARPSQMYGHLKHFSRFIYQKLHKITKIMKYLIIFFFFSLSLFTVLVYQVPCGRLFPLFSFVRRGSGVLSPATHTHPLFSFFLSGQHNMKYSTNIHGRPIRPGI
jgi:hypothetical protein